MLNGLTASGDNMWLRRWDAAQKSLRDGSILRSLNLGLCSVYVVHVSKGLIIGTFNHTYTELVQKLIMA